MESMVNDSDILPPSFSCAYAVTTFLERGRAVWQKGMTLTAASPVTFGSSRLVRSGKLALV
jgi:hypothetical protein